MDQIGAVVVGQDFHARQQPAGRLFNCLTSAANLRSAGSDSSPLRSSTMPWTTSSSSCHSRSPWTSRISLPRRILHRNAEHDPAQAGLVADDHALVSERLASSQRPAFDHVVDADGNVVGRGRARSGGSRGSAAALRARR